MATNEVQQPPATDQDVEEFVEVELERRRLELKLKEVKAVRAKLEPLVLEYFEQRGIQNIKARGVTVYVKRELWASKQEGVTWEAACDAFIEAGLKDYVGPRFNHMSVSAYCRELDEEGEDLHPALQQVLKVSEKFTAQTRKG